MVTWREHRGLFTAQKMKFSIKDFLSKCDQTAEKCGFGNIYWRKPLIEHFIFCTTLLYDYLIGFRPKFP